MVSLASLQSAESTPISRELTPYLRLDLDALTALPAEEFNRLRGLAGQSGFDVGELDRAWAAAHETAAPTGK